MNKQEKLDWIMQYIRFYGWQDAYTEKFVSAYIRACAPKKVETRLWVQIGARTEPVSE